MNIHDESLADDLEYDTVFKTEQNTANAFVCRHPEIHSGDEHNGKLMTEKKVTIEEVMQLADKFYGQFITALKYDHLTSKENTADSIACRELGAEPVKNTEPVMNTEAAKKAEDKTTQDTKGFTDTKGKKLSNWHKDEGVSEDPQDWVNKVRKTVGASEGPGLLVKEGAALSNPQLMKSQARTQAVTTPKEAFEGSVRSGPSAKPEPSPSNPQLMSPQAWMQAVTTPKEAFEDSGRLGPSAEEGATPNNPQIMSSQASQGASYNRGAAQRPPFQPSQRQKGPHRHRSSAVQESAARQAALREATAERGFSG